MKPFWAALLALMTLLCAVWAASAEDAVTVGDFQVMAAVDGGWVIVGYAGSERDLVIPAELDGQPVVELGAWSFRESDLTGVVVPEGVTSIRYGAFENCASLERITIPASVTSIGGAFIGCPKLTELVIAEDHPSWYVSGDMVLDRNGTLMLCLPGSTATRLRVPEEVTAIGDYACCGCANLIRAELPDRVERIGVGVFAYCAKLEYVGFPKTMTVLPALMFRGCATLPGVMLPEGLTRIEYAAFQDCTALKRITFPASLTYLGENAFYRSGLTKVTLSASLSVDLSVFHECKALTEVRLEEGATGMPYAGFLGCDSLRDVYLPASATYMGTEGFDDLSRVTFHVARGSEAESYMIEYGLNYKTDYPVSQ